MLSDRLQDIYNKENIKVRRIDFIDPQLDGVIIGNTVYESDRLETAHEQNISPKDAMALLGHNNIQTTMDVYTDIRKQRITEIEKKMYGIKIE